MRHAIAIPLLLLAGAAVCAARPPRTDPTVAAMDAMIQEEYRSAAGYERLSRDFGGVAPFATYVEVERSHAELLGYLYIDRGLPVPPSRWSADALPAHRALSSACAALLATENEVIRRYDGYLESPTLPADVRRAFRHNRNVAAHLHVPELRECSLRDVKPR
ncbi:MAG TPA: hypothetical protein VF771_05695 [Longimicrobiaceae bacterium]